MVRLGQTNKVKKNKNENIFFRKQLFQLFPMPKLRVARGLSPREIALVAALVMASAILPIMLLNGVQPVANRQLRYDASSADTQLREASTPLRVVTTTARGVSLRRGRASQQPGLNFVQGVPVFVFTFSDTANKYVCNLLWSAMKCNISVHVLGYLPPRDVGNSRMPVASGFHAESSSFQDLRRLDALEKAIHYLSASYPTAIILWLDADVLFQQPLETAVKAFLTMEGRPALVWSAERTCWPSSLLCSEFQTLQQGEYAALNCGAAIGHLGSWLRFFKVVRSHLLPEGQVNTFGLNVADITVNHNGHVTIVAPQNDQEFVQALFADTKTNEYVGPMALDRRATMFFSLGGGGFTDLAFNTKRGRNDFVIYRHASTGVTPAILHFNGLSKRDGEYRTAELRPEPRDFQEAVLLRSQTVLQEPRSLCAGCSSFWLAFITEPSYPIGYFKRIVDFWRDDPGFIAFFGTPCEQPNASCSPETEKFYSDFQLSDQVFARSVPNW
jgi:hypothetical protein